MVVNLMAEPSRQFKSVWRKGEPAPEHVIDRAVNDISAERREVTNNLLHFLEHKKLPNNSTANSMLLASPIKSPNMKGRSVSGAKMSRREHFVKASMDYIDKWNPSNLPKGYYDEHPADEGTPDYPKDIDWGK